jgi:ABC-type transporter Mla MlaB component
MGAWCRVTVMGAEGVVLASWSVSGPGRADLAVVEALACLQLAALRRGRHVVLTDVCTDLLELLDLVGLRREVCGKAEGGEEHVGIEECVEPADPSG